MVFSEYKVLEGAYSDIVGLVNLVFNWETVRIPAESSLDVVTILMPVARYCILRNVNFIDTQGVCTLIVPANKCP